MSTEMDTIAAATMARLAEWEKVEAMTDEALAEAFLERVWGALVKPDSIEDRLATELLQRFERLAGVEREEGGEIVRQDRVEEGELPEALEYMRGCVQVAEENGEDFMRVRVERVRDLLGAVQEVRTPRGKWEV